MTGADGRQKKKSSRRESFSRQSVQVMAALVLFTSVLLVGALFRIQVLSHNTIEREAADQYYQSTITPPARGDIYDRNGVKLAGTSFVYRIGVTPSHVRSRSNSVKKDEIADQLAKACSVERSKVDEALAEDTTYVQIAKNVPEQAGKELEAFLMEHQVGGVKLDAEARRYYTNGNLASQVIGFASYTDQALEGLLGVEYAYNKELSGTPGMTYAARDNYLSKGTLPYSLSQSSAGSDGNRLDLTLDTGIQKILQEDLEAAIKGYDAQGNGMGICINPYSGEIYAMASYPYFRSEDPYAMPSGTDSKKWKSMNDEERTRYLSENVWRNKNISDLYEAGSTMKAITAAMGLEENVTTEKTTYRDDPIEVLDATISCYGGGHGIETLEEGFWRSCNPVFVQVALALGIDKFYDYIRAFGFYESTGIDLPGESSCIFHTNPSVLDMANLSFGESSSVTPLHLLRAYCALVNGGKVITPHVVKQVVSPEGIIVEAPGTEVVRRVISAKTSTRVRELMKGMVKYTEGYTNSWGYDMGGKTSTSTDELSGQVTVSFAAVAPIDHPEIITLMILQRPKNDEIGGAEAQVVTMDTCSRILDYMNVDRHYSSEDAYKYNQKSIELPNFVGMTMSQAAQAVTWYNIQIYAADDKTGGDSEIKSQIPEGGTVVFPGTRVTVSKGKLKKKETVIPDLSQMNYNEVMEACNQAGLVAHYEGDLTGHCVAQAVGDETLLPEGSGGQPGDKAYQGMVMKVTLSSPED